MPADRELWSVTQTAEHEGVTRQAILKRLRKGTIEGFKTGNTWNVYADQFQHRKTKPRT